jgi:recombination protein RecT
VSSVTTADRLPAKPTPKKEFLALLEQSRPQVARLIPSGDERAVDRFLRVVRTAYKTDPKVRDCSAESILVAVLKACELGLEPGGAQKHAYLIPYKGRCTLQISYFGMLELARRSGQFKAIEARVVRRGDRFDVEYDPEPQIRHRPTFSPEAAPEPITFAYAYARLTSGALVAEVMTVAEVEYVRSQSQSPDSPAWENNYGEMAKKTVLKRLLKRQPYSAIVVRPMRAETNEAISRAWDSADEPDFAEGVSRPLYSEADDPEGIEPVPATAMHQRAPQAPQKAVPSGDLDADDAGWDQGRE